MEFFSVPWNVIQIWVFIVVVHSFHGNVERNGLSRVKRGWLSSGKPADVKCAFNPCSVDGFCGDGRTCNMDDNCIHHCDCDIGSAHELCAETSDALVASPKPVKCTFNPCLSLAFACDGNRDCVLNEVCMRECQCSEESTHASCFDLKEETMVTTTIQSTYSTTEVLNTCQTRGIVCLHGDCTDDGDQLLCICSKGWGGDTCNVSLCTTECSAGFYCHFVTPLVHICVESIAESSVTSTFPEQTTRDMRMRSNNVCSDDYSERNSAEQQCPSGISCKFGVCAANDGQEICQCDAGASGALCDEKCCRECGDFGTCISDENVGELCDCHQNYTGFNCTRLKSDLANAAFGPPEEITWHYWVVGACALVLVIMMTLMVVVPYFLWRNRVILVMKVVHYFQGYEDDDDRQWDAFISYKSNKADEHFVVKTLFPKLERDYGFKINVHFRDFVPGETIANNIISAVQGSRRTIMIITPSYITSEFTKFEYQIAQQEMLKRRHRIIPILLEDITAYKETMDPNLKVILNSVTYIQWPQDGSEKKLEKFWKRIDLSMPKIKNRAVDSEHSNCQTNGVVTMTRPADIKISIHGDTDNSTNDVSNGNVYTIIEDNKVKPEEVYDMLNESEIETKVIKKKQDSRQNTTNEVGDIVLKM